MITYLLKLGELVLKGGNRREFERVLKRNLEAALGKGSRVKASEGRFFVYCAEEDRERTEEVLDRTLGLSGWARARVAEKNIQAVLEAAVETGRELFLQGVRTFKIEARRTDKSFPLGSYDICCRCGEAVAVENGGLLVDVRSPQAVIGIEIREKAYIYGMTKKGRRGLPVGTAGRGLLLLSGGIDSPVAGYMMASRGMGIDAVYFHAYPYTSEEARQKVIRLTEILGRYTLGIRLYTIGFTDIQRRIKEKTPSEWGTVLLRMAMMDAAEKLARRQHHKCLITGESLSQVASQTIENITCTQSRIKLPVLRPLIGMDKEAIISTARSTGTYETSILPYEDCCVLFSPPHPILRGDALEAGELYDSLNLESPIAEALSSMEMVKSSFSPERRFS